MKKTFPQLQTNRLILSQFTANDIENVYKGLSHPDVIKYYGVSFKTLEETKEQMQWFADLEKNETGIWWAIRSKDNQEFLGAGGLNDLSKKHKKAEIGFWLLPNFWGKGIMKEDMNSILDYAFNTLNLHRIEGFVESNNQNCKNALKKVAFQYEGTMKDYKIKNGKYISIDIFAKIK